MQAVTSSAAFALFALSLRLPHSVQSTLGALAVEKPSYAFLVALCTIAGASSLESSFSP